MSGALLGIHKTVRKYLIDYLKSEGYRIHVVDQEPHRDKHGLLEQRYICGYRFNAMVLTITEGPVEPEEDFVAIHTDPWLLLKHGKMTFNFEIQSELMAVISGVNWIFKNAETEEDKRKVQSLLKCTYEEFPQWDN